MLALTTHLVKPTKNKSSQF